ncbi:MAG: ribulose-phosphate 3-epimerase [Spirochaetales bacterium]|nr:ribulose-phosphate 3-epimerase [Spirochaetales bacterium]
MGKEKPVIIAPSLLASSFSCIGEAVKKIEAAGGDWVHFDVMDGVFVPDITFGHKMVKDARPLSQLPFDVHLMVTNPEAYIGRFAEAGADYITFHYEAVVHIHRIIMEIHGVKKKAGISIVPSTPASHLSEVLPFIDMVLVMTVNPGYGGQTLIPETLGKVSFLKEYREKMGYNYHIEVDGGIDTDNARSVIEAGADVIVSGTGFFTAQAPREYVRFFKQGGK